MDRRILGERLPPGPNPFSPGRLLMLGRDPLRYFTELREQHGRFASDWLPGLRLYLVQEPELIREVLVQHAHQVNKSRGLEVAKLMLGEGLVTSEGDFHKRQRRLAQPAFHHGRVMTYGKTMVEHALKARESWRPGQTLEVTREMMALTLNIVAEALFGASVTGDVAHIGESLDAAMESFDITRLPVAFLLDKLPLPKTKRFHAARDRLDAIIYRFIAERRASGEDRGDLLSMLLLAQDAEGGSGSMTDRQLRDEAMTLFLAGHETTANALSWTLYLLSQNPYAEARLHRELDEVLGGRAPSVEDFRRLPYTEMVFAEAMRLYPPAWTIARRVIDPFELGGFAIPHGSYVVMSQWVNHRDPELFPNPERFDPERFTPEAKAARPKFAYFPFGGGPRVCIGEGFAWMEGVLVLATLCQKWRFAVVPGHKAVPQPRITLRLKYGLPMVVHERKSGAEPKAA